LPSELFERCRQARLAKAINESLGDLVPGIQLKRVPRLSPLAFGGKQFRFNGGILLSFALIQSARSAVRQSIRAQQWGSDRARQSPVDV
jgi:hypothetical protein